MGEEQCHIGSCNRHGRCMYTPCRRMAPSITKSDADHPWGGEYIPDDRPWPNAKGDAVEAVTPLEQAMTDAMDAEGERTGDWVPIHLIRRFARVAAIEAMRAAHVTAQQEGNNG